MQKGWLIAVGLVLAATAVQAEPRFEARNELLKLKAEFDREVAPVVRKYCVDCHGEGVESGSILLDPALSADAQFSGIESWLKAADTQRHKQMPPADSEQPSQTEREALIAWTKKAAVKLDTLEPFDPGPIVFRRLTRRQYNNTMQDLFGVEFDVASRVGLTRDPEAFGYDSIATVLEIPPTQMEKYIAAADEMLDRVIVEKAFRQEWKADELEFVATGKGPEEREQGSPQPVEIKDGKWFLRVKGATTLPLQLPLAGSYRVAVRGYAFNGIHWQNYQGDVALQLDGETRKTISFTAAKPNKQDKSDDRDLIWSDNFLRLPAGEAELTLQYLNPRFGRDWNDKHHKYLVIERILIEGPVAAPGVEVSQAAHDRIFFQPPGDDPREAARQIITRFTKRAWRRPVSDAEINRLMQLFDLSQKRGFPFERSVRPMLKAAVLSPWFLFRIEEDWALDTESVHRISDHELATRLSYFLWGTMPDDELRKIADEGRLSDSEVLRQQTQRMLDDKRARHLVDDFAVQWLHLEELDHALPSEDNFPEFDAKLRTSMRGEVLMFFEKLIELDRPITDLIDSDYTWINRDLVLFYRIGGHLQHVWREQEINKRRNPERGGLLGMGAVLAMTSHVDRNSPTRRGKWILDVMLGDPPPPPPANVEQINEGGDKSQAKSFRELLKIHADESSTCAGCHRKMDPLGFALDHFNPIGKWQRERNGQKIDASGKLPDGREVNGVQDLKELLLSQQDRFARNLTEQMLIYALGRDLDYYDRPAIARILEHVKSNEYRMRSLILGIVESYPFQHRRNPEQAFLLEATKD